MSNLDILSDKSNKELVEIPDDILLMSNLRMLYLEGNFLRNLPDKFFKNLPNLTWLDLRNNQLEDIPSNICDHKNLQTLLLQNNNLEFLPNEIGLVHTLQMLQVSGNPILYPPQDILDGGTRSICIYLKSQYDKVLAMNEDNLKEKDSDITTVGNRSSTTSTSKISVSSSEPPKRTPRSATLSIATLPVITVKSLSKSDANQTKPSVENKELVEKKHKVVRQCPKFTVKSKFINGNKSIQTVMKFKAKGGRVDENILKEIWLNKLKDLLADQERLIQQEKNLRSLNDWRLKKKLEPERLPSEEEVIIPPYATDNDYDKILSKEDIRKQLDKLGKNRSYISSQSAPNIDRLMDDVLSQLKNIENKMSDTMSPRMKIKSSEEEIKAILELHKRIASLQILNNTY